MKRPTEVYIGWMQWRIRWVRSTAKWCADNSEDDAGSCHVMQGRIDIRVVDGYPEDVYRQLLMHELLHACWHVSSTEGTHIKRKEWEEVRVGLISPVLLAMLRDNPKVTKYLRSTAQVH